jgi:hypothetical protein
MIRFGLSFSPLLLLLSLSVCLSLTDISRNPLQRPTLPWQWELSCVLALPPDPPWKTTRIRSGIKLIFHLSNESETEMKMLEILYLPITKNPVRRRNDITFLIFCFNPLEADSLIKRLDPLEYYQRFATFTDSSFLTTSKERSFQQRVLVAAADLSASFKAADTTRSTSQPYILHAVDESHIPVVVDTGASTSVIPNTSDCIGPIKQPVCESLQGLGDSSKVDGQGIIEWQIRFALGTIRTIRTHGYLVTTAPVRLFSPQTYFKELESSPAN